jgi:hypothetical protein
VTRDHRLKRGAKRQARHRETRDHRLKRGAKRQARHREFEKIKKNRLYIVENAPVGIRE